MCSQHVSRYGTYIHTSTQPEAEALIWRHFEYKEHTLENKCKNVSCVGQTDHARGIIILKNFAKSLLSAYKQLNSCELEDQIRKTMIHCVNCTKRAWTDYLYAKSHASCAFRSKCMLLTTWISPPDGEWQLLDLPHMHMGPAAHGATMTLVKH